RVFESKVLSKIEEILNHFSQSENLELAFKKHHTISKNGKNKELDGAIFYLNKLIIGIEINFYTTSGSKVTELFERAYPDLQNTLVSMGANLLIVTDGKGWRIMRKTIRNAFYRLENICNYYQLEEKLTSLLQKILK
ncbi:MAG: type II restriction endonuclease, partial [Candidatus Bipolaricaulota bacterium]|nr:type II restriction endonuclease [Candidatus Bipolaricaulota bacterium]